MFSISEQKIKIIIYVKNDNLFLLQSIFYMLNNNNIRAIGQPIKLINITTYLTFEHLAFSSTFLTSIISPIIFFVKI